MRRGFLSAFFLFRCFCAAELLVLCGRMLLTKLVYCSIIIAGPRRKGRFPCGAALFTYRTQALCLLAAAPVDGQGAFLAQILCAVKVKVKVWSF